MRGQLIPLCLIVLQSGCFTLLSRYSSDQPTTELPPKIYEGTYQTIKGLGADNVAIIALVDLPFSFALDTVLLPLTIYEQFFKGSFPKAAAKGDIETVRNMLARGADINALDAYGRTALMNAVWANNVEMVELLLEKGADANARRARTRETALMFIPDRGDRKITEMLLNKGADVNARATDNETALIKAADRGNFHVAAVLVDHGADVNARGTYFNRSALYFAARRGEQSIVRLLLGERVDIKQKNEALLVAAWAGNTKVIEQLLDSGAEINFQGPLGETALMEAARSMKIETVELLLSRGADTKIKNHSEYSAWQIASRFSSRRDSKEIREKMVRLLKQTENKRE